MDNEQVIEEVSQLYITGQMPQFYMDVINNTFKVQGEEIPEELTHKVLTELYEDYKSQYPKDYLNPHNLEVFSKSLNNNQVMALTTIIADETFRLMIKKIKKLNKFIQNNNKTIN